jgi:glycosyltransferase involved in cell wall biosynthesis
VRESLDSILTQTYPNLVVHVSDNASTDDTIKVIESIEDPRVTIHQHFENIGGEGNFNRCIQMAEGKYTAIFHADDIYEPDMVAKQVAFLEAHPEAGAVFTEASLVDEAGDQFGNIRLPKGLGSKNGLYDFPTMFKAVLHHGNFFICPSFMFCTQVLQQEIKVWRGDLFGSSADLDVWLRILQKHLIGHLPERLIRYRISKNQFSARIRLETKPGLIFKILDYYLEQGEVKAMLHTKCILNYKRLERRDRVSRAMNLFLIDRPKEAGQLLHDIYSLDALEAAFQSLRGLMILIVGGYVKLLVAMGLHKVGKVSITYMKQVTHR